MKADIFVPTSNRFDALRECLESLSRQTNTDFRLIIVSMKENTKIRALIDNFNYLDILYLIQKSPGLIGAANEALLNSKNDIFIRIDDDTVLSEHWYNEIINTFNDDDMIGGVTGPTIMSAEGIKARDLTAFLDKFKTSKFPIFRLLNWVYTEYLYEGKMFEPSQLLSSGVFTIGSNYTNSLHGNESYIVGNLEACNWSCRTKILKENGGFDEIYLRGLGDYHEADAALKIMRSGYKLVFNPAAWLQHKVEVGRVAKARPAPYWRIQNFIIFYFRFFQIRSFGQLLKFCTNLFLQNAYYLFRFFTTGSLNQLGALVGTLIGILRVIIKYKH